MKDFHTIIERYFDDDLNAEELKQFQTRLREDAEFARAFQIEKDLMDGIEVLGNENLKATFKDLYQEEVLQVSKAPANRITLRWYYGVAAAIALLIAVWFIFSINQPLNSAELYAQYFQYELDYTTKGNDQDLITQTESAIKEKNYAAAIPILESLLQQNPDNPDFLLAKGIALVETGALEEGITTIQNAGTANPSYQEEARWYEALALLKMQNLSSANQVLNEISENSGRYQDAQNLRSGIKQLLED